MIPCTIGEANRLPLDTESWYECEMVKAYIGIASSCGLESFLSERENTRFVIASGADDGQVCRRAHYWAAVSDEGAAQIRECLRRGDRRQALLTLDTLALDIAPLERFARQRRRAA